MKAPCTRSARAVVRAPTCRRTPIYAPTRRRDRVREGPEPAELARARSPALAVARTLTVIPAPVPRAISPLTQPPGPRAIILRVAVRASRPASSAGCARRRWRGRARSSDPSLIWALRTVPLRMSAAVVQLARLGGPAEGDEEREQRDEHGGRGTTHAEHRRARRRSFKPSRRTFDGRCHRRRTSFTRMSRLALLVARVPARAFPRLAQADVFDAPVAPALAGTLPAGLHRDDGLERARQPDRAALRARRACLRRQQERDHQRLRQPQRHDADAVRRPAQPRARLLGPRPAGPRARPRLHLRAPVRLRALRLRQGAELARTSRAGATAARRRRAPTDDGCVITGRLSRLNAAGAETVLIEDFCQQYPSHSLGTIDFGPDGMLYVSRRRRRVVQLGRLRPGRHPVNPCGDPAQRGRRAALAELPPRPRAQPATLDGAILRVNPDTGAAARRQPGDRRRRPAAPPDRRLRPAQPVPLHLPPGHGRDLVRRRRLEHRRGDQPHAGRHAGPQLRLAVLRGRARHGRLRLAQPRQLRDAVQRGHARPRRTSPTSTPRRSCRARAARPARRRSPASPSTPPTSSRPPTRTRSSSATTRATASGSCTAGPTACRTRRRAGPSWPAPPARSSSRRARTARSTTPISRAGRSAGSRPTTRRRPRASPPTRPPARRR